MKTTKKNRNEELHDVRTSFTIETKQQKQTIPHYDDWLHLIYSITFNGDWNITVQFQNIALKWHAIRFGTCIMCIYSNIYSIRVCSAQHVIHWNLQAFPNIGSTIEIPNMLQCSIWCVCVIRLNGWNTWAVARRLIENMFQTIDTNYAHNHSHNSIHAAHALPMFAIFRQKSILLPYTPNLIASNKFPFSYLAQLYLMHFHLGVCVCVCAAIFFADVYDDNVAIDVAVAATTPSKRPYIRCTHLFWLSRSPLAHISRSYWMHKFNLLFTCCFSAIHWMNVFLPCYCIFHTAIYSMLQT